MSAASSGIKGGQPSTTQPIVPEEMAEGIMGHGLWRPIILEGLGQSKLDQVSAKIDSPITTRVTLDASRTLLQQQRPQYSSAKHP